MHHIHSDKIRAENVGCIAAHLSVQRWNFYRNRNTVSKILDIPQRSAIQLVKTVTFDINYNPVEFSISKDRGLISKFKLTLNRKKNEK